MVKCDFYLSKLKNNLFLLIISKSRGQSPPCPPFRRPCFGAIGGSFCSVASCQQRSTDFHRCHTSAFPAYNGTTQTFQCKIRSAPFPKAITARNQATKRRIGFSPHRISSCRAITKPARASKACHICFAKRA